VEEADEGAFAEDAVLRKGGTDGVPGAPDQMICARIGVSAASQDSQIDAVEAAHAQRDGQQGEDGEGDALAKRKQSMISRSGTTVN
jgi:hypothetical protein